MKDGRETNRALISLTGLHRSRVNRWNARTGRSAPSWELRLGLPAHLVSPESSGIFVQWASRVNAVSRLPNFAVHRTGARVARSGR
jgi:hypothetical protein